MYASSAVRPLNKVSAEGEFATHCVFRQENMRLAESRSWLAGPVRRTNMRHCVWDPQKAIKWDLLHYCRLCPWGYPKNVSHICALRFCLQAGSSRIHILCCLENKRFFNHTALWEIIGKCQDNCVAWKMWWTRYQRMLCNQSPTNRMVDSWLWLSASAFILFHSLNTSIPCLF